jgi:ubiquinone/menaquinone biosynthesis C-methylase UbiE
MPFDVFDIHAERYDRWYNDHKIIYRQELQLIRHYSGALGWDLEIGVGTGRFAAPLGIRLGIDPSLPMLRIAKTRGGRGGPWAGGSPAPQGCVYEVDPRDDLPLLLR